MADHKPPPILRKMQRSDRDVFDLACERAEQIYKMFDHVLVAFSCGKDSTALLEVASTVAKALNKGPVTAWFYDVEILAPETLEYGIRVKDRDDVDLRWLSIPLKERNACSRKHPYWYPWHPDIEDKWVRPFPDWAEGVTRGARTIPELVGKDLTLPEFHDSGILLRSDPRLDYGRKGSVCTMVGLRGDESMRRRGAVLRRKAEHYNYITNPGGKAQTMYGYPIYDWSNHDVWTVVEKRNLDYNRAYDAMRMAGVSIHLQRVATPFGEEPLQGLHMWRNCWPTVWAKMGERVPGARTAMEYGRSAVYGMRTPAKLFPGWEDNPQATLEKLLNLWGPKEQSMLRERVAQLIRHHQSLAGTEPIPLYQKDSDKSGVGWNQLIQIVQRGDLKGRVTQKTAVHAMVNNYRKPDA